MSTPFSTEFKIIAPPIAGQPECPVPLNFSSSYDHRSYYRLEFTGTGSKTLDLGTLGPNGAKLLVISVDADPSPSALPVLIAVNASTPGLELSAGGLMVLASPRPTVAGALAVTITHASSAKLNVWAFG